jgi:general secretion pathway protein K
MALLSVLWGIALLSIVAASFLSAGGVSYRLAHNAVEIARTDAVAEAAVNRAVLAMFDQRLDRRWRTDGVAQALNFDGTSLKISIQDELGRIDLNHADASLLIGLFKSVGRLRPHSLEHRASVSGAALKVRAGRSKATLDCTKESQIAVHC